MAKTKRGQQTSRDSSAARFAQAAQSDATTRSYAHAVRHFLADGGRIPSTAEAVASYLARHAGKLAVATLQHRLVAIHRAHADRDLTSPVMDRQVKRTMQGIRRTYGIAQRRVRALVKDDLLEALVLVEKQAPLKAARDAALLLLGFAGAFRRSELVGLNVEDVVEFPGGLEVTLKRSKTDQEGAGRTVFIPQATGSRCPVRALRAWLTLAQISVGPVFRPINRHGKVAGTSALTPQSVALIVKFSFGQINGPGAARTVSGHSLRAGFVTEAAVAGLQPYQIREVTGHRSDSTLARYIRPVAKRKIPSLL